MRIMAANRWEASGSCECYYQSISWREVIDAAPQFIDAETSAIQLNPAHLGRIAKEIEGRRALECEG